jgi:hypothetical protein
MFKAIGWFLKASFFAIVVLIASHFITWNGKSVSDQVRSTISSAERANPTKGAMKTMKKKSRTLVEDAKDAAGKIGIGGSEASKTRDEAIPSQDREELQALIHAFGET